jgi:nucleotide-binding universal stress UspA family protein
MVVRRLPETPRERTHLASDANAKEIELMQRILFPTDGSVLSERALQTAAALAEAQAAELVLVRVVEPPRWVETDADTGTYDWMAPDLYEQVEAPINEQARAHLDELARRLRERGLRVRTRILHGFAANELLLCELEETLDLVVMASHGRTGLARFALGSVADRLVRESARKRPSAAGDSKGGRRWRTQQQREAERTRFGGTRPRLWLRVELACPLMTGIRGTAR